MSATGDAEAGFTLLETLVTLALTVMIALIVFPSVGQALSAVALVEAKQVVISDFRLARARAMAGGAAQALAIADDGHAYAWSGGQRRQLAATARIDRLGDGQIAFFPDGSASPGALALTVANHRVGLMVQPTGAVSTVSLQTAAAGGGA
jgi:Tfp pilus assembly protein FimT